MKPVPSLDGEKINWLNYRTGVKDVIFKMDADNKTASISIEIIHADLQVQQLIYGQFLQLKNMFENMVGNDWNWLLHTSDGNGKVISRIFSEIDGVSVFKKSDWPEIISFFKPRIIALDEFWSSSRYSFESLQ